MTNLIPIRRFPFSRHGVNVETATYRSLGDCAYTCAYPYVKMVKLVTYFVITPTGAKSDVELVRKQAPRPSLVPRVCAGPRKYINESVGGSDKPAF